MVNTTGEPVFVLFGLHQRKSSIKVSTLWKLEVQLEASLCDCKSDCQVLTRR